MLRSAKELLECVVDGSDGAIGRIHDLYFDDQDWAIRFLVVETGAWLEGRRVLISPVALRESDWEQRRMPASITREQVAKSPAVDSHKPVSRQHEVENLAYYGYPPYWGGSGLWGHGMRPASMLAAEAGAAEPGAAGPERAFADMQARVRRERGDDPHLRSLRAMIRYHVRATDGEIGHVDGMIIDEGHWTIDSLIVNTSDWWLGHQVLVAPKSISDVSWLDATVLLDLDREAVRHAPAYAPRDLADPGTDGTPGRP